MICHPPNAAYEQLLATFRELYARTGADLAIGRRLRQLLLDAGLAEVGVEARADLPPPGHSRRTVMLDLVQVMRPKLIAAGLLTAAEHDEPDREARAHIAAPETIVMPHLSFLAWGRVPEGDPVAVVPAVP